MPKDGEASKIKTAQSYEIRAPPCRWLEQPLWAHFSCHDDIIYHRAWRKRTERQKASSMLIARILYAISILIQIRYVHAVPILLILSHESPQSTSGLTNIPSPFCSVQSLRCRFSILYIFFFWFFLFFLSQRTLYILFLFSNFAPWIIKITLLWNYQK